MQPGLNPASLPPGTQVGPWRIVDALGSGTHGAVYLAEGRALDATVRVAVKLAHQPLNARFFREVELLSRIRHPCVPRLIGHGQWAAMGRLAHTWLAMEFVDGLPLYEWARAFAPSSRQVLRVLAGLARALEATHAVGGVHRDVKGDNALVRGADGQPFLIDFGSCTYPGAAPLTQPVFPPQTQEYRSPEAFRFGLGILTSPVKVYAPKPAEDVFALGVTGYRLVTGEYPPRAEPTDAGYHVWKPGGSGPQPARELNGNCGPELSALISRMLSLQPEARGSASELASALERAARKAGPHADVPLFPVRPGQRVEAESVVSHRRWWVAAGVAGAVAASLGGIAVLRSPGRAATVSEEEVAKQLDAARDAGTAAVGESVLSSQEASPHAPSAGTPIAMDKPPKPLPGQLRPDANGRCRYKSLQSLVPINDGCWMPMKEDPTDCAASEGFYSKGVCYMPFFPRSRPSTSEPPESRDGG
jgi:serine/threonine-protein kinase